MSLMQKVNSFQKTFKTGLDNARNFIYACRKFGNV